ncbi:hypothetical protein STVA_41390 [Allostella vacuolata]|nr:hypothetical protein STVA_41390 [Stella vacuolata]
MAIDWAGLAGLGLRAFALPAASKAPRTAGWTIYAERAPTAPELEAWSARLDLNAGIVTGAPSGVLVLDLTEAALRSALASGTEIPETPRVRTLTGWHLYFQHPGFACRRILKANRPADTDILGDGRYAMAPGSIHPSGRLYEWDPAPSEALPFAPAPAWLLARIERR